MILDLGHVVLDGTRIAYNLDKTCLGWVQHMSNYLSSINNPVLGLSGGVDSEAIAEIMHRNKINFTTVIFDYNGANQHDTAYAIRWCNLRHVEYLVLQIDPVAIWSDVDACLELASITKCISPQFLVYMHIYKRLAELGTPIMGMGDIEIVKTVHGTMLVEKTKHFTVELYKEHLRLPGTTLPFQRDRNAMSSWINDAFWQRLELDQNSRHYKADWYKHQLGLLKRTKRDGFENLRTEDHKLRAILEQQWPEQLTLIETAI